MSWFWGSKTNKNDNDDEEEYSDDELYSDEDEEDEEDGEYTEEEEEEDEEYDEEEEEYSEESESGHQNDDDHDNHNGNDIDIDNETTPNKPTVNNALDGNNKVAVNTSRNILEEEQEETKETTTRSLGNTDDDNENENDDENGDYDYDVMLTEKGKNENDDKDKDNRNGKITGKGIGSAHSVESMQSAESMQSGISEDNISMIHSDLHPSEDEIDLSMDDDDHDDDHDHDQHSHDDASSSSSSSSSTSNSIVDTVQQQQQQQQQQPLGLREDRQLQKNVQVKTIHNDDDDDDDDDTDSDDDDDNDHHDGDAKDDATTDDDDDDEKEEVTSFWEKQSLLILAAEHDRVDILKAILTDEDDDRSLLMKSGIPPLHVAISFGSTNATQSLLRMGADPSIRPDVAQIKKQQQQQQQQQQSSSSKEQGKVEIPNMQRFDGISAWELAFGNKKYEEFAKNNKSNNKSWSFFGKSSNLGPETPSSYSSTIDTTGRIIKPVEMAPSKREGIRHAFTAESLRCIGGDEVDRLRQLLDSGMPPSIDIGGKDLYGWAVEMGAMQCEELLRPVEAAKHGIDDGVDDNKNEVNQEPKHGATAEPSQSKRPPAIDTSSPNERSNTVAPSSTSSFRVLDRPPASGKTEESTVSQLINRLDELESLATALSTCLDNLAEEVSVCHGLLLMGGGASALASHVKSLKTLQYQKAQQLVQAQDDWEASEQELAALIQKCQTLQGGDQVVKQIPANLGIRMPFSRTESFFLNKKKKKKKRTKENGSDGNQSDDYDDNNGDSDRTDDSDSDDEENDNMRARRQLIAQIAASENKIRKLRLSIADLSDENTKEMEEVERRGLSGGIDLVRGLRDELRECDYQLSETKSSHASCRAKIAWIHSKIGALKPLRSSVSSTSSNENLVPSEGTASREIALSHEAGEGSATARGIPTGTDTDQTSSSSQTINHDKSSTREIAADYSNNDKEKGSVDRSLLGGTEETSGKPTQMQQQQSSKEGKPSLAHSLLEIVAPTPKTGAYATKSGTNNNNDTGASTTTTNTGGNSSGAPTPSERIATGDSQALARRPNGSRGYFTVDLWQVLLRIIGFDRAAARRGVEVAQKQPAAANLMTL